MSLSLSVIRFRDLIPFTSLVGVVEDMPRTTIEISGEDFSSVDTILINDVSTREFIIVNKQKLYVRLPTNVGTIRQVSIRSLGFTRTSEASIVDFTVGNQTKTISGTFKLTQLYTRWLLTSPGTDIYRPEMGGGLRDIVGAVASRGRVEPAMSAIVQAVSKTEQQLRTAQSNVPGLSVDEKLLSADIDSLSMGDNLDEIRVRILLTSLDGQSSISSVVV